MSSHRALKSLKSDKKGLIIFVSYSEEGLELRREALTSKNAFKTQQPQKQQRHRPKCRNSGKTLTST